MNILIFSVAAGGGHNAVAYAIRRNVLEIDEEANVKVVDTLRYINKALHKVIIGSYLETIKYIPKLYGHLYEETENYQSTLNNISEFSYKILSLKLKKLIQDFQPDKIVCTHPFPSEMLAGLKKKGIVNVEVINVLTDFTVHPMWLNSGVDTYITPAKALVYYMEEYGVDRGKVKDFGIPIRNEFASIKDKALLRGEMGFLDQTTILLMGGSLGYGALKETVESLLKADLGLQLIIVCGQNQQLYGKLKKYSTDHVHILGYVENVYELMDVSDFIVTKPGGITVAEAICKELPMILTSPIPGQEVRNIEFLLNNGVGVHARDSNNIIPLLKQLLEDKERVELMKIRCRQLRKPLAGQEAAMYLLDS